MYGIYLVACSFGADTTGGGRNKKNSVIGIVWLCYGIGICVYIYKSCQFDLPFLLNAMES